jgi:hypothetical protein
MVGIGSKSEVDVFFSFFREFKKFYVSFLPSKAITPCSKVLPPLRSKRDADRRWREGTVGGPRFGDFYLRFDNVGSSAELAIWTRLSKQVSMEALRKVSIDSFFLWFLLFTSQYSLFSGFSFPFISRFRSILTRVNWLILMP